jgi:bifunctional non-homologous end joining protein LigD
MSRKPEAILQKVFPPMLATLASEPPRDESQWVFELKYDGFRAVSAIVDGEVAMWSRNSLDLRPRFASIATSLEKVKADEAVIDGEVVALDPSGAAKFQLLQRSEGASLVYFVFDILWLNGHDLRKLPLYERRELLQKLLARAPRNIRISEQMTADAATALAAAAKAGQEGLIGKLRDSKYESRRSKGWIKLKATSSQEMAIIGFTPSSASPSDIGALLLGVNDGGNMRFAGKVGTGFSAKLRSELKKKLSADKVAQSPATDAPRLRDATWVQPKYVAQVVFTEWTSDGKLRHPSFVGMRDDKSASEVVRERPDTPEQPMKTSAKKSSAKKASARKASTPAVRSSKASGRAVETATKEVQLTNPDRLLYPRDGITKQDVADYFQAVSAAMIHTLRDRPLALEHWNQGIDKPSWFRQDAKDAPEWATIIETPTRTTDKSVEHLVVDRPETLRWLAQRSALTLHMWSSRGASLELPDWLVFDLDPAKGKGIEQAIDTALVLRRLFEEMEIPSVPKTSGKRGIHLFIPLAPGHTHEEAADFACRIGGAVAAELPYATMERSIAARKGRLYLDCLQNGYGKTLVAPYSLRAIDGAPVSAPLKWSEINKKLDPLKFNLKTMPKRLDKVGDLFADVFKKGIRLSRYKG